MSTVSALISFGIGSPASVPQWLLFGTFGDPQPAPILSMSLSGITASPCAVSVAAGIGSVRGLSATGGAAAGISSRAPGVSGIRRN